MTVLLLGAVLGAVLRRRAGRLGSVPGDPAGSVPGRAEDPTSALAGVGVEAGAVTLVQFSSSTCGSCRSASRVLAAVTRRVPGVRHVELDVDRHVDAVRALDVWRTPTVLVLDSTRRVTARTVGVPREAELVATVRPLLRSDPASGSSADA